MRILIIITISLAGFSSFAMEAGQDCQRVKELKANSEFTESAAKFEADLDVFTKDYLAKKPQSLDDNGPLSSYIASLKRFEARLPGHLSKGETDALNSSLFKLAKLHVCEPEVLKHLYREELRCREFAKDLSKLNPSSSFAYRATKCCNEAADCGECVLSSCFFMSAAAAILQCCCKAPAREVTETAGTALKLGLSKFCCQNCVRPLIKGCLNQEISDENKKFVVAVVQGVFADESERSLRESLVAFVNRSGYFPEQLLEISNAPAHLKME